MLHDFKEQKFSPHTHSVTHFPFLLCHLGSSIQHPTSSSSQMAPISTHRHRRCACDVESGKNIVSGGSLLLSRPFLCAVVIRLHKERRRTERERARTKYRYGRRKLSMWCEPTISVKAKILLRPRKLNYPRRSPPWQKA